MAEYTTKSIIYSQAFCEAMAGAWTAAPEDPLMDAATLHLIKDPDAGPTPQFDAAAFAAVEADYTGYSGADKDLELVVPANLSSQVSGGAAAKTFNISTGPVTTGNSIYGYWVESAGVVVGYEMFDSAGPFSMGSVGDFLILDILLPMMEYQQIS